VDYLETGEEQDVAFLQQMQAVATPVGVSDSGSSTVALKLVTRGY
jgi:phage gp36-like protein